MLFGLGEYYKTQTKKVTLYSCTVVQLLFFVYTFPKYYYLLYITIYILIYYNNK